MNAVDPVSVGRAAWERLCKRERTTWADWLAVGRALAIGRTAALKTAETNRPLGSKYNRAMGAWLAHNGFDGINSQERYRIALCLENLPAIEAWRAGLNDARRRRLNHPSAIWAHWKQTTKGAAPPSPQRRPHVRSIAKGGPAKGYGRAIHWSQDAMRRAHQAMLDSRSSDLLTLARVALQAAIRSEADLLDLLPPEFPARPRRSVEKSAAQTHAQAA